MKLFIARANPKSRIAADITERLSRRVDESQREAREDRYQRGIIKQILRADFDDICTALANLSGSSIRFEVSLWAVIDAPTSSTKVALI